MRSLVPTIEQTSYIILIPKARYSLSNTKLALVIYMIQTISAIVRDVTTDFTEVGKLLDTGQS